MKKGCPTKQILSPFMDKELPPAKMKEVEHHLTTCEVCRKEMEIMSATEHLLTELPELEPSNNFERSFMQKLSAMEEKKLWSFSRLFAFRWQPYIAATVMVLIVAGAALFHQGRNRVSPNMEDVIISENLELFEDYETIDNLDLLINWEAIMTLEEA